MALNTRKKSAPVLLTEEHHEEHHEEHAVEAGGGGGAAAARVGPTARRLFHRAISAPDGNQRRTSVQPPYARLHGMLHETHEEEHLELMTSSEGHHHHHFPEAQPLPPSKRSMPNMAVFVITLTPSPEQEAEGKDRDDTDTTSNMLMTTHVYYGGHVFNLCRKPKVEDEDKHDNSTTV